MTNWVKFFLDLLVCVYAPGGSLFGRPAMWYEAISHKNEYLKERYRIGLKQKSWRSQIYI